MITPHEHMEYLPSGLGELRPIADTGEAWVELVTSSQFCEVARLGPLWSTMATDRARRGPDGSISEVADWCASALVAGATRHDPVAIGSVLAVVFDTYRHRGWAIAAAAAAAGLAAAAMPAAQDLIAPVSQELLARFARLTGDAVAAAPPDGEALSASGWPPPGLELAGVMCNATAESIATMVLLPERSPPATARLHHSLDLAARQLGYPVVGPRAAAVPTVTGELVARLARDAMTPWTWETVAAWRDDDPLAAAKAIARTLGLAACVEVLDDLRAAVGRGLDDLVAAMWPAAVATRIAELSAPLSPLVAAIVELADSATAIAARRIGTWIRARWDAGAGEPPAAMFAELLGDPRAAPQLWQPHAAAIQRALGVDVG